MVGFMSGLFGSAGTGVSALGNLWFLIGLFILIFFILLLSGSRASAENIVIFVLTFLLLVISYGLFAIPPQMIIVPIVFIMLYLSKFVYNYFNQQ